ncbi:MAG: redoxin domain-containing protein [Thiobacillaceae bacterium]
MRWAVLMAAWLCVQSAFAAEPASFTADSLAKIEARYAGKPFILSLWSANWCGHCITELTMLGKLLKTNKNLPLVLVATDGVEFSTPIEKTLHRLGLARVDSWVFDDDIPERLRNVIDPAWRGEIPRTYLYDKSHQRQSVAGVLDKTKLEAWLRQQGR